MSSLPLYTGMYDPDTAGFLGGPRRVEAYKPAHRGALLTWNSSRDAATTRIESYRVSNGNLGCPWPVDVRPELEKEREALRSRLGTAEGRMRDIEGMLARRGARRGAERSPTKSERPATATGVRRVAREERSPKSIVDYEEEKPPPAYPRRRPATAPRQSLPSGFGTQRNSTKATAGRTKFGKADERTQPERYWPLTKNRAGAKAGFHEAMPPPGRTAPIVKIKAPVRRDRRDHFHYYDDMPARFMGQTKVRKPQDYDPVLQPPRIATTHQRTSFKSTYRFKPKRFQPPLEQLSWRI